MALRLSREALRVGGVRASVFGGRAESGGLLPGSIRLRTLVPMSGSHSSKRRVRRPVVVVAALFVLAVVAVSAYLLVRPDRGETEEPPVPDPTTTTLAVPTPEAEPIEAETPTALSAALPDVVLDHVLTSQEADEDTVTDLGAFEVWQLTYSAPGSDVQLQVVQWHDEDEAAEHLDELTAEPVEWVDGQGRRSGDVAVEGESVGRYEIGAVQEAEESDPPSTPWPGDGDGPADDSAVPEPLGPGLATWSNGTVVFIATGDAARLALFYDNFPF